MQKKIKKGKVMRRKWTTSGSCPACRPSRRPTSVCSTDTSLFSSESSSGTAASPVDSVSCRDMRRSSASMSSESRRSPREWSAESTSIAAIPDRRLATAEIDTFSRSFLHKMINTTGRMARIEAKNHKNFLLPWRGLGRGRPSISVSGHRMTRRVQQEGSTWTAETG